ncbi:MAG: beta-L-arabinofuranosidase domain-containing protein [Limisphaerales bacterium]
MRPHLLSLFSFCATVALAAPDYPVQPVPFTVVRFTGGLLHDRQATNTAVTLPFALEQCETSGRLKNFDLAAEVMRRRAAGETNFQIKPPTQYPFDDTDVFKAIEGAAFSLSVRPDPALAARLEAMIRRIAAAQEPDGYLYTFRTMHPDSPGHGWIGRERWEKDPQLSHELYNLGHLFEAGTAHYQATGSRSLLAVCLKAAELLHRDFRDGEPRIAPGHQVIEMGLVRLHRQTGDPRWLGLARFFLENRGRGGEYSQDHRPVLEQDRAVGHAVRANYMYAGMADVAALTGDARYFDAIHRIWRNVVGTKLHLTGGCGARASGEAYGDDYELPHRCYNETCAAVAFLFWNHRMFLLTGEGRFMDVFERTLYNGALSGVSLSGDRFFYPNPLEYDGQAKNNHGHAGRAPWFGCACCPPNLMRTLAALGDYLCAVRDDTLYVNLHAASAATATLAGARVELEQMTDYPWNGTIRLRVTPERPLRFTLALRIPGWVEGRPLPSDLYRYDDATPAPWTVEVNGERQSFNRPATEGTSPGADAGQDRLEIRDGFARITRNWRAGDLVALELPMPVRRVAGHPKIAATKNQVALERGPIVYAFEGVDNDGAVFDLVLPETARITPEHRPDLLGGVTVLRIADAARARREDTGALVTRPAQLLAIPYATWANRGLTPMAVWLARDAATARPTPSPTLASQAKVTVSFARAGMSLAPINDQLLPENFTDGFAPNFDFWPRKGTTEWITYEFARPATVRAVRVSWFDDTGTGECRLPAAWRVLHRTAEGRWEPVKRTGDYPTQKRAPVRVSFEPVTTTALRLEIQLPPNFSAGVYEWEVE